MNFFKIIFVSFIPLCFSATTHAQSLNVLWQKSFGGSGNDGAWAIQQTTDDGYIVAASSTSNDGDVSGNHGGDGPGEDYWIIKLDFFGNMMWQKSLGGTDSFDPFGQINREPAYSVQQTTDGGYIVTGYSASTDGDVTGNHGGKDFWVVKLTPNGDIKWQKSLGGSSNEAASSIQQTTDGGYIISGVSKSSKSDVTGNHGGYDYWIVKLAPDTGTNALPAIEWQKSLGGSGEDMAYSVQQTTDGGYIVAGSSNSTDGDVTGNHGSNDYWIVKLNSYGNIMWQKSLGGSGTDNAYSIQQTTDGGYIIAGETRSNNGDVSGNHGLYDYWVVKLAPDTVNPTTPPAIEWQKALGGSDEDIAQSIQQTQDGEYIVAGASKSDNGDVTVNHGGEDFWVVKLASNGDIKWQKSLGGRGDEWAHSVRQTKDGKCIIAGVSTSYNADVTLNHGGNDVWIVKLDGVTEINEPVYTDDKITVYPNLVSAANGFVNIKIENLADASLVITNTMGQVVYSNKASTKDTNIDITNYSKGIYFIKIQGKYKNTKQEIIKTEKFIVQ